MLNMANWGMYNNQPKHDPQENVYFNVSGIHDPYSVLIQRT